MKQLIVAVAATAFSLGAFAASHAEKGGAMAAKPAASAPAAKATAPAKSASAASTKKTAAAKKTKKAASAPA
jgi:hypothetical protein